MVRSKAQLLASSVSLLALGIVAPSVAHASVYQQDDGVFRSSPGVNIYTVTGNETHGEYNHQFNGNANQTAFATVSCATSIMCANPGSILETAFGANATNYLTV
ncbi:MAG: hypothetical protein ACM3YM_04935, partial [Sphingomonadales bacterium]